MQTAKTTAGPKPSEIGAGEILAGFLLGGLIGVIVGLKTSLIVGLIVAIGAGVLITLLIITRKRAAPDRKGRSDGGSGDGGSGDWAHTASQRCFDGAHQSDSGDWGGDGDGGDCGGGDGGGGGD